MVDPNSGAGFESQKRAQQAATLHWVEQNYEWSEGICVPRCVLYQHYQDFCQKMAFLCVGPATFGKIIRQRFPKLTTRRLGTRGQSRYHYYGIGIKESSPYYKQAYTGKRLSRFSGVQIKTEKATKRYCLASKTAALLPEFPKFEDLVLDEDTDQNKAKTFLVMYRTHSQRILDTVVSASFSEVPKFLSHFWHGMPEHLLESLASAVLARVVAACDVILYKIMNDVLIPSTIQELPESLYKDIKAFVTNFAGWLEVALEGCPECLRTRKLEVASWFVASMKKQLSFIKLAQTTRSLLNNSDATHQMGRDLDAIDMTAIAAQIAVLLRVTNLNCINKIKEYYQMLVNLLQRQSPLEDFMEWIDDVIGNCLSELCAEVPLLSSAVSVCCQKTSDSSADFVLIWSYLISLITRDLTLQNSASFGSVHVMHLMFDEYVYLVIETQRIRRRSQSLQRDVEKCLKPGCKFVSSAFGLESETAGVGRHPSTQISPRDDVGPSQSNVDQMAHFESCWMQPELHVPEMSVDCPVSYFTSDNQTFYNSSEISYANVPCVSTGKKNCPSHDEAQMSFMFPNSSSSTGAPGSSLLQPQQYESYFESAGDFYLPHSDPM